MAGRQIEGMHSWQRAGEIGRSDRVASRRILPDGWEPLYAGRVRRRTCRQDLRQRLGGFHLEWIRNMSDGIPVAFFMSNEGMRLLENAAHIEPPVPDPLKKALAQLHGREKKDAGAET